MGLRVEETVRKRERLELVVSKLWEWDGKGQLLGSQKRG